MREPSEMVGIRDRTLTLSWTHFILTFQVRQSEREMRDEIKRKKDHGQVEKEYKNYKVKSHLNTEG